MAAVLMVGVHNAFQTANLDASVITNPPGNPPLLGYYLSAFFIRQISRISFTFLSK